MRLFLMRNYFLALSIIATALLWGVSLWNGTVKELVVAAWYGNFQDGMPFETNYTGFILLDFPISLLVAFFFYGTNGTDTGYQHFLIDAYSTLQSAFIWLYVESNRQFGKPPAIANPIIWGLLWQCFGAAIALPLYYYNHLTWVESQPLELAMIPLPSARAIPISFAIGALLPAVIGMLPTWFDRSARSHQKILAVWQPDPVWVSVVQTAAVLSLRRFSTGSNKDNEQSFWWTRTSYLIAAASSATGHIYVIARMTLTNDVSLGFTRMYIPFLFTGPAGVENSKLLSGPWLFLQYDLIIISFSSLSWAYLLTIRLMANKAQCHAPLLCILASSTAVLGPGATVSLALFWREGQLQRQWRTSKRNSV